MAWGRGEELVNWSLEPGQPLWIISGLKETFMRYVVERLNKAEVRQEKQRNGGLSGEFME